MLLLLVTFSPKHMPNQVNLKDMPNQVNLKDMPNQVSLKDLLNQVNLKDMLNQVNLKDMLNQDSLLWEVTHLNISSILPDEGLYYVLDWNSTIIYTLI